MVYDAGQSIFQGYWFVATLLLIRLLFEIKPLYKARYAIGIVCFLYSCVQPYIDVPEIIQRQYLYHAINAIPFFAVGMLLKDKKIDVMKGSFELKAGVLILFFVLTLVQGYVSLGGCRFGVNYSLMFVNACLGSYLLFNVCYAFPQRNWITVISSGTFIILGLHAIVYPLVGKCLSYTGISTPYHPLLIALLTIAVIYPLIYLFSRRCPILLGKVH